MIIGVSGYARHGKDTVAEVLVEEFGFKRVAFADKLRDFLYALNPRVGELDLSGQGFTDVTLMRVRDVVDRYGWDGYKQTDFNDEVRGLLQRLGTEAGRNVLWENIWVDAAFHDVNQFENIVVPDCRFPNEAGAIRERGGQIWRVHREGFGPAIAPDGSIHPSETSLDDYNFDVRIENTSTLEGFKAQVRKAYEAYGARV